MNKIAFETPVKLVDSLIIQSFSKKASDLHIEPFENFCRARVRVDGELVELGFYDKKVHEEVVSRLKILSALRTDLRLTPQDGRFRSVVAGVNLTIRISVVPSFYGEKCVLRILPQSGTVPRIEDLGFSISDSKRLCDSLVSLQGMVLVVGPTGSGKTTTLYSLIGRIAGAAVSVVTLEDPVEYSLAGITQIPVQHVGSLTFSTALRSVVRQDPDVIMVGEIRDIQTAELSVHSALTGHLLLSTLHTNDSATALIRLVDLGVEPFLVASTVKTVVSQRLVRKNCQKCLKERKISHIESEYLDNKSRNVLKKQVKTVCFGAGCANCFNTGFSGRTVVSEVLTVDENIRGLIVSSARADEIQNSAISVGMIPLYEDALTKVGQGITTIQEISSL